MHYVKSTSCNRVAHPRVFPTDVHDRVRLKGVDMRKVLIALVAAALSSVVLTAPAGAEERTVEVVLHDGAGDVWVLAGSSDVAAPAPDVRNGDLLATRAAHRARNVVVRLRFAELGLPGQLFARFVVKTDAASWFAEIAVRHPRLHPAGRHHLWHRNGDRASCPGMRHRIDYEHNWMRLRIPRSCLDLPTWVRVQVQTERLTGPRHDDVPNVGDRRRYVDNPHNDQAFTRGLTSRLYRR